MGMHPSKRHRFVGGSRPDPEMLHHELLLGQSGEKEGTRESWIDEALRYETRNMQAGRADGKP